MPPIPGLTTYRPLTVSVSEQGITLRDEAKTISGTVDLTLLTGAAVPLRTARGGHTGRHPLTRTPQRLLLLQGAYHRPAPAHRIAGNDL